MNKLTELLKQQYYSLFELVKLAYDKINEIIDHSNNTDTELGKKVSVIDLEQNRKLSAKGDFSGTWNGLRLTQTDEGVTALIEDLAEDMTNKADIDKYIDDIGSVMSLAGSYPFKKSVLPVGYSGLQGATIIGDRLYFTANTVNDSSPNALLVELNYPAMSYRRHAVLPLYHANDIVYNGTTLVIPHTSTNTAAPNTVSIIDIATLTIIENKVLSKYVYNLCYDAADKVYYGCSNDFRIVKFDENLNYVSDFLAGDTGYVPQGCEFFGGMVLKVFAKQNSIYMYKDGKLIKKYAISEGYGELETAIAINESEIVLGFNSALTNDLVLQFYKVNLLKGNKLEQVSKVNGHIPYLSKEQSIDIYVNSNYTGLSDGTEDKPFKRIEDALSVIPTNSCYVDLYLTGVFDENVLLKHFAGVQLYIQNLDPTHQTVKIKSISATQFYGELTIKDININGTNNKILASTNNGIEVSNVNKLRLINVKINNEGSTATSRGVRALNSKVFLEGATEITNVDECLQLTDSSELYCDSVATFTFSANVKILDIRASKGNVSSNFMTAMNNSLTTYYGAEIKTKYIPESDGCFPNTTGDVATVIRAYVDAGYKNGKVLFGAGSTNIPVGLTTAFVKFEYFTGSTKILLKAQNFTDTATKEFTGEISSTNVVTWKSYTLT